MRFVPHRILRAGNDWDIRIKQDPGNHFSEYNLKPGEGIVFAGSAQWHYRDRIIRHSNNNFCHLIFFHFTPKGTWEIIDPSNWARLFGILELMQIEDGK